MEQDRSYSTGKPKPGPKLIRAWFDTVVNPLLNGLHIERQYLERKDWSWNHWRGKLESILPVVDYLGIAFEPNLRQFYGFYPDIEKLAENHDASVRELLIQCMALQNLLQSSEEMRELYRRATSPKALEALQRTGQKVDYATSEEEDVAVYAEYVINSRDMLPPHYTTSGIWNTWRDQFLGLQKIDSIKPDYKIALGLGEELNKRCQSLADLLADRRNELSIEYDVPIVSLNEAA